MMFDCLSLPMMSQTHDPYARLKAPGERCGLGNISLRAVLLGRLDDYAEGGRVDVVFQKPIARSGAPTPIRGDTQNG